MLHAGLDLSRKRLDVCLIADTGELIDHIAAPPDADGLRGLARRVARFGARVRGVIESMNGARFVHDMLEEFGWEVLIADAQKVKGLAPLAVKTDKIDARVLAELSWRDLVPAIWLPDSTIRRERELARYRLHLVRHRTTLNNRIHASLITFGQPCPVSDLFGYAGRELLDRSAVFHRDDEQARGSRLPLLDEGSTPSRGRRPAARCRNGRSAGTGRLLKPLLSHPVPAVGEARRTAGRVGGGRRQRTRSRRVPRQRRGALTGLQRAGRWFGIRTR
jgi:hypothetical protein